MNEELSSKLMKKPKNKHSTLLGVLKSSIENMIIGLLLSVLPSFCIKETILGLFCPDFRGNYKKFL